MEYIAERFGRSRSRLVYLACEALGRALPRSVGTIEDVNAFAAAHYLPGFYHGRLTLFRAFSDSLELEDQQMGWGPLVGGGVEVHQVPGDHDHITSEPYVKILARELGRCLDDASSGHPGSAECPSRDSKPAGNKLHGENRNGSGAVVHQLEGLSKLAHG